MFNRKQSASARKIDLFNFNIGKIQTDTCQQTIHLGNVETKHNLNATTECAF